MLATKTSCSEAPLQARIDDERNGGVGVCVPIAASLANGVWDDSLRDLVRSLHDVDVQSAGHVPCDVTMEGPHTWVVRDELDHNKARSGRVQRALNDLHITSLRVGLVDNGAVPCALALRQDVEVVTVQMHGMRRAAEVLHHEPNASIGPKVVDVPLRIIRIRGVPTIGKQKNGVVHVSPEAGAVHLPEDIASGVGANGDADILRGGRRGGGGERKEWDRLIERVVGAFAIVNESGHRCGSLGGIGAVVVDSGQSQRLFGIGAFADERSHEDRRSGGQLGLDNHVCALSHSQGHHIGFIRLDRHKVIRHHRHGMVVDGESQDGFGRCVDQSEPMLLARDEAELGNPGIGGALAAVGDEGAVEVHFAIDEIVVRGWSSTTRGHDAPDDAEIFFMVPIVQQDRAHISIIGGVLGSVDDHRAEQTSGVLTGVMRMIPTGAVQIRFECVCQRFSGGDWALLDRRHPVKPGRRALQNAVPVQGRSLFGVGDLVGHSHLDRVAPVGFDEGSWKLTVDQDDAFVDSVRGDEATLDGEIIGSDDPGGWRVFKRVAVISRSRAPWEALRQRVVRQEVVDQRLLKGPVRRTPIGRELGQA